MFLRWEAIVTRKSDTHFEHKKIYESTKSAKN